MAYTRTRDWATVDYYAALGVERDASVDDIARAFRLLAKQLHPDAGAPVEDGERFKDVARAYDVLSDPRARRDYDSVRAGLLPRPRAEGEVPRGAHTGAPPSFRAAQPRPLSWTPRRAWLAFVGGLVVTVLGVGMALFVVGLQHADAQRRSGKLTVTATRIVDRGTPRITFRAANGTLVETAEPPTVNPGVPGSTERVLYDPAHPTHVIADESYAARDITLWIVAIKLLVGGPVFTVLGGRALRRMGSATAAR